MKNNQKYLGIFASVVVFALSGCRFRREISVSMPAESEEQIQVESNTNIEKEDGRNYLESIKFKEKRQYGFKSVCTTVIRSTNNRRSRAV